MMSAEAISNLEMGDRRFSTTGYTAVRLPPSYVACLERHKFSVSQNPGISLENEAVIATTSDDIPIVPEVNEEKSSLEKPNDYLELSVFACLFNFLFAMVAMSLSFRSRDSWKLGDRSMAQAYGIASMAMSLFSIITTAIIIFVLVWLFVLGGSKVYSA